MKYKFLFSLLFSLILGGMVATQAVADDYACQVNTLIGTKGTGSDFRISLSGSNLSLRNGAIYSILFL